MHPIDLLFGPRRTALSCLAVGLLAASASAQSPNPAAIPVDVRFEINDALVKGKQLMGVEVTGERNGGPRQAIGVTGPGGVFDARMEPGKWLITYRLAGYVPIERTPLEVTQATTVTATLSPMLEAVGEAGHRRVQLVLNWGSRLDQVRDVDAHLRCGCPAQAEVFFGNQVHDTGDHSVELDVDDTDGGGPETITLLDPPAGEHEYFVVRYSSPPPHLNASEVVVRVIFDDQLAGEFRCPADLERRVWRPFKRLVVGPDLAPRIVPFTAEELAAGADRSTAEDDASGSSDDGWIVGCCTGVPIFLVGGIIALSLALKNKRRR